MSDNDLRSWEREAIEDGNLEAEWEYGPTPRLSDDGGHVYISYAGVDYGKELPDRLKDAGVEVVNERGDVDE